MLECLKSPKEWAKIARIFPGRTQHQIKNRFIRVLSKELNLKREKISYFLKNNTTTQLIYETLKSLKFKKQANSLLFYYEKNNEETEGNDTNEINEITKGSFLFKSKSSKNKSPERI